MVRYYTVHAEVVADAVLYVVFCNLMRIMVLVERVVGGSLLACQLHVQTVFRVYLSGFLGPLLEPQQRKPPKYVPNLQGEGGV